MDQQVTYQRSDKVADARVGSGGGSIESFKTRIIRTIHYETRVISTSVKMLIKGAGKHKDLVKTVFEFFAVFPEDVPVPSSFFHKMTPLLSDDKNAKKATTNNNNIND